MCFVSFQIRKLQGFALEFQNLQLFHVSVMLRNRYRAVTHKQLPLMADHHQTSQHTIPYFFNSPRFKAFTTRYLPQTESVKSPTSILDHHHHNKSLFPFGFQFHSNQPKSPKSLEESKRIGLAIVDTLNDDDDKPITVPSKTSNTLFGMKLKVEIPEISFQPALDSSPRVFTVREMELSEDYTCVKSHGPNPKITHIYDNCVVNTYCNNSVLDDNPKFAPAEDCNFLSFCHTCNKNLQQKIDIYIYRGEKAFCSQECRNQEMLLHGEEY